MRSVMISIRPEWCEEIIQGQKMIELRKTKPKIQVPFKVFVYCTKGGKKLNIPVEKGKVIGEFVCDTFVVDKSCGHDALVNGAARIEEHDAAAYAQGNALYGWHISALLVYDKPKEFSEFAPFCKGYEDGECMICKKVDCQYQKKDYNPDGLLNICKCVKRMQRPPQSWCYVEEIQA